MYTWDIVSFGDFSAGDFVFGFHVTLFRSDK